MASAPPDDVVTSSLSAAVLRAARKLESEVEAELAAEKLTIDHWLAIDVLMASDGLTMAELQSLTMTAGPTLTRVVDKLVTESLAYREVDALDRRKVRVYLSKRGVQLHRRMSVGVNGIEVRWAAGAGEQLRASITQAADRA